MGVIAAYRRVLGNEALARLLFGEFVSSIGDWLYLVALLVLIWNETNGDAVALGIIGAARIVPYILLSIPAGIVADRYDRRKVLLATDIARGLIMLLIAGAVFLNASIWVIVALAILATCFSSFFSPAIGAYLPSLVRDESELGPANSAWSSLTNLAFFIGPAFAATTTASSAAPETALVHRPRAGNTIRRRPPNLGACVGIDQQEAPRGCENRSCAPRPSAPMTRTACC